MSLTHWSPKERLVAYKHEPLDLTPKHLTIKHDLVGEKPATKCSQNN